MALQSSVGIKVGVSAILPTTHDDAATTGFPGMTYTNAGKLNAAPPMTGTRDIANFDNLSTGEEEKVLDILRAGNGELTFGFDETDAGQIIIETASVATTTAASTLAMEFTLPSGRKYYRLGIITNYAPTGAIGSVMTASANVEFTKKHVKVNAV
jgi:hypothetical protein